MIIERYSYVNIITDDRESEAVKLAAINLKRDLLRTLDCHTDGIIKNADIKRIAVGTAAALADTDSSVWKEICNAADLSLLKDECGKYKKESYELCEHEGVLYIVGADRRGTVYGIYELCSMLGVSPWYFFADVPVKRLEKFELDDGFVKADSPSVEYRGIFINDEEELESWVQRYMGEETIGVKTYEKIFELLLRLKLNYIWPAMHVNSFNLKPENGALADRMGIIVGTSHCDMLMRSNYREWEPWLKKKGYTDVEYDFSIQGRNREILKEYWRESVEQNGAFEVSYTLGMRGIHDSGFETRSLAGLEGEELRNAKIKLLESVIAAQQDILKEELDRRLEEGEGVGYDGTMKIFVPYKEVLELYDNGLKVPEDLTLIWTNDNYGYVRRYPGEEEKKRSGGNGIYYHNSYWAAPDIAYTSHLFICSIPLSHTRNELLKAYDEGITRLWATNFGAIKPLEMQMSFYARLAWTAGRHDELVDDEELFVARWIDSMFSGEHGKMLAPLLLEFDQLTNVRKLEHLESDVFSQTAYGDEAAARLHCYERIFAAVNAVYDELPLRERDAFFQLVAMRVHAAYFTYSMYYYADRSALCASQGKNSAADKYVRLCLSFDETRRKLFYYYNRIMSNGKWDGMLTPEDYPPTRAAMHPAAVPALKEGEQTLIVTTSDEQSEIVFDSEERRFIELANAGEGELSYRLFLPKWIKPDESVGQLLWCSNESDNVYQGKVSAEKRIMLACTATEYAEGEIFVRQHGKEGIRIKVRAVPERIVAAKDGKIAQESRGRICLEADSAEQMEPGWRLIPHLGRGKGSVAEAVNADAAIGFSFELAKACESLLEIHRFPTLNSVGHIRIRILVDGEELSTVESTANDEHRGQWCRNILNNVDKLELRLPFLEAGVHKLSLVSVDKYFTFSRLVIYTQERRENNLGYYAGDDSLPAAFDAECFARSFYGVDELEPRPMMVLPLKEEGGAMPINDVYIPLKNETQIRPEDILALANTIPEEKNGTIMLETASALAQTAYARTKNGPWQYCISESHRQTGLAMLIRAEGLKWTDIDSAPTLIYRFRMDGGHYRMWMQLRVWGRDSMHFKLRVDGRVIEEKELYGGQDMWRYSIEQVWRWIPVWEQDFAEGEHEIEIYCLRSRLRFDRICITRDDGMPQL